MPSWLLATSAPTLEFFSTLRFTRTTVKFALPSSRAASVSSSVEMFMTPRV
jgi:hypothetical protein